MDLERLRAARSRASAARRVVTRPQPLGRPYVIVRVPEKRFVIGHDPLPIEIHIRNVGDQACALTEIVPPSGLTVEGEYRARQLLPRSADQVALGVVLEPFSLPSDDEGAVTLALAYQANPAERAGTEYRTSASLVYQRASSASPVLVKETRLSFEAAVQGFRVVTLEAPEKPRVSLRIETGPGSPKQIEMLKRSEGVFAVAMPLIDGEHYAYRFDVDGVLQQDPRVSVTEHVPRIGACSPLDVPNDTVRSLHLRNGSRQARKLSIVSRAPWLVPESATVHLSGGEEKTIGVHVSVNGMSAGSYEGLLQLEFRGDHRRHELKVPVSLLMSAPGPIPAAKETLNLDIVHAGVAKSFKLAIQNVGDGVLEGQVLAEQAPIQSAPFAVPAGQVVDVPVELQWEGEIPKDPVDRQIRLFVQTNTLAADLRVVPVLVSYRLIPMRLDPAEIDFGVLACDTSASFQVAAIQGATHRVDVTVETIPPKWLKAVPKGHGLEITVDGEQWEGRSDERVRCDVKVTDPRAGTTATLTVSGTFVVPAIQVSPRTLRLDARGTEPAVGSLLVQNTRAGELLLKRVVVDQPWLSVEAIVTDDTTHGIELRATADATALAVGRHRAQIDIESSDRRRSKVAIPIDVRRS